MSSEDWPYQYVKDGKKRRKLTPQMRALKARRQAGLKMAKPSETMHRIRYVVHMIREDSWDASSVSMVSLLWDVSKSRVEQIAAEARRIIESENGRY